MCISKFENESFVVPSLYSFVTKLEVLVSTAKFEVLVSVDELEALVSVALISSSIDKFISLVEDSWYNCLSVTNSSLIIENVDVSCSVDVSTFNSSLNSDEISIEIVASVVSKFRVDSECSSSEVVVSGLFAKISLFEYRLTDSVVVVVFSA